MGGRFGRLHRKVKARSDARFALRPDAPAHHFDQAPGDSQTEAGSTEFAGGGGIGLAERFEDGVQLVGGDTHARIGNDEMEGRGLVFNQFGLNLKRDFSAQGKFEGISHQVDQDLPQPSRVADDSFRHVGRHFAQQFAVTFRPPARLTI